MKTLPIRPVTAIRRAGIVVLALVAVLPSHPAASAPRRAEPTTESSSGAAVPRVESGVAPGNVATPSVGRAATPSAIAFQGFLTDDLGVPLDTTLGSLDAAIYDVLAGGTPLWQAQYLFVPIEQGVFSLELGAGIAFPTDLFDGGSLWIGFAVDGGAELAPRTRLLAAPFANRAMRASSADALEPGAGVTTLNGLTDDITLTAGANVTITPSGNTLTIDASGGGGSDADWTIVGSEIYHDGPGTVAIGTSNVGTGQVLRVNGDSVFGGDSSSTDGTSEFISLWGTSGGWIFGVQNEATEASTDFFIGKDYTEDGTFHIEQDGDVGMGTSTPAADLHLAGASSVSLLIEADTDNSNEADQPSIVLTQDDGAVEGRLGYFDSSNRLTLMNAYSDKLYLGTNDLNRLTISSNGNVGIGTESPAFALQVVGTVSSDDVDVNGEVRSLSLDVQGTAQVDILEITGGADLAEPFRLADDTRVLPGMVLVIDPANAGRLRVADRAYDRRVAGVASGANGVNAGITLRQEGTEADGHFPVALTGRAYCLADAEYGAIEPGDRLTTSPTSGHAMRVADDVPASGAILGKAMTGLRDGRGHVLVLVTLQ